MRNHEITKRQPLLDAAGTLTEPGWSRSLLQEYARKDICLLYTSHEWFGRIYIWFLFSIQHCNSISML